MMSLSSLNHDDLYPSSYQEAAAIQARLAAQVSLKDGFTDVQWIGGCDVSNNLSAPEIIYASCLTLNSTSLEIVDQSHSFKKEALAYKTGFLAFREMPALVQAWHNLKIKPQLLMVDGHGISHPRGLGIASHLGVLLNIPTIGVAKTLLVGKLRSPVGPNPGDYQEVVWRSRVIAIALRTRKGANPLFIAPGHKIGLKSAVEWVVRCGRGYRLPEPTRQAHLAANTFRLQH